MTMENREIKFRAWNPILNQMEYCSLSEYWWIFNNAAQLAWGLFNQRDGDRIISSNENDAILMQYTGLKDKEGNEIYEKDWILDNVGRIWLINFNGNMGGFVFKYRGHGKTQYFKRFISEQLPLKIIGNTYENKNLLRNPELLEK